MQKGALRKYKIFSDVNLKEIVKLTIPEPCVKVLPLNFDGNKLFRRLAALRRNVEKCRSDDRPDRAPHISRSVELVTCGVTWHLHKRHF